MRRCASARPTPTCSPAAWRTRGQTLAGWRGDRWHVAARLVRAQRRDRADAARRGLGHLRPPHPGPDAVEPRPATAEPAHLSATCCRSSTATAWCWRCTRPPASPGFIAGASMPLAAEQRTGFSRWIHVKAGELAILFVSAVTLFSLCTQALYLGFQGSTLAFQLHISPSRTDPQRPPARADRADRALPAARRLADRQPPRRVEPAARRDRRHRRHRDPDAARRGDDRGLRLAPHPPLADRLPLLAVEWTVRIARRPPPLRPHKIARS